MTTIPLAPPERRVAGRTHHVNDDGTRVHLRTCPLCECMCGLELHLDDEDRVKLIRPHRDDVFSQGYICPKGTTLGKLHEDPDRVRTPLIREGDTFREATWDEAFARCEELIHGVLERHGPSAMTAFVGNPVGHSFSLGRYGALLFSKFPHIYSSGTVDQWPKNVTCALMYGNQWKIPAPDVPRTDFLVIMGGNPQASGGSLLACPDVLGEIDAIKERGGQVIVVDPRRTGTADHATEWLPIRPGTDAAFLLALCHVLFSEDLITLGTLVDKVDGLERLAPLVRGVHARVGRGVDGRARRDHPPHRPRLRGHTARRGLRAHRAVQPGVRNARVVARRRGQHRHRPLRRRGRPHVGQARQRAARVAQQHRRGRRADVRPLAVARAGRPRGARAGAGVVPRGGDRDTGRGPDQAARDRRREPGHQRARRGPARSGTADARLPHRGRQLRQRDHALRPRHPARASRRSSRRTSTS